MDAIQQLQQFNQGRSAEGLALKYRKMQESAWGFLRGSCHLFYARLAQEAALPVAPLVWSCGDMHVENFGSFKADSRKVCFDINDFDEAALAPASWDLVRMLCSIAVAAESVGMGQQTGAHLGTVFLDAYAAALAQGQASQIERKAATGLVRRLLDDVDQRKRSALLDKFTDIDGKQRVLRMDGTHASAASPQQQQAVRDCMRSVAAGAPDPEFYEVQDVAQRLAGTGSLGLERYVVLVRGKGKSDGHYLLDMKLARPSALLPHLHVAQPQWPTQAQRVVDLQRRMQAASIAFLQAVQLGESAYVLRELQASEDRIALQRSHQDPQEQRELLDTLGQVLAWAHLRGAGCQGAEARAALAAFGQTTGWKAALHNATNAMAAQVLTDWTEFCAAYEQGRLHA